MGVSVPAPEVSVGLKSELRARNGPSAGGLGGRGIGSGGNGGRK